jgi:NAD(P)-dependent dehydrogenase (short-subunit alcohol dehydrogenase family)
MSDTIVITGASNGIGAALAKLLLAEGKQVIALDIAPPDFDGTTFIKVDLSDPASIADAIASCPTLINGLCNCAGLPPRDGLEETILAVNFHGTKALTKGLEDRFQDGASIVNLASRAGARWRDGLEQVKRLAQTQRADLPSFVSTESLDPVRAYDLSKEAVILWTMAYNEQLLNKGLRINSISPGAVETRILDDFATAFGERMSKNVKRAGRAGTADEIAKLAHFLLSPASNWIKGTDISIDGGMSAFMTSDALSLGALCD